MERKHEIDRTSSADNAQAQRESEAQEHLLALGASELHPRPWRPDPAPPTAVDLTQYALWRASDLSIEGVLSALAMTRAARAEVDGVEAGLLFVARGAGLTWAQIADAMGFRSPQACQQYVTRLSTRQGPQA